MGRGATFTELDPRLLPPGVPPSLSITEVSLTFRSIRMSSLRGVNTVCSHSHPPPPDPSPPSVRGGESIPRVVTAGDVLSSTDRNTAPYSTIAAIWQLICVLVGLA